VVCFSGGNGQRGWPGSHPDVISVGGVHVNYPDLDFEASSYASSFDSTFYPGRHAPDLCGLTGRRVDIGGRGFAPSLMLPVQPGSALDAITPSTGAGDDGWGLFSGTSAACPQVAGVVALLLERDPTLLPADVKQELVGSARDVTAGTSAMGDAAGPGPDAATGAGLVDAK
jgi:subtilisin family serine protease